MANHATQRILQRLTPAEAATVTANIATAGEILPRDLNAAVYVHSLAAHRQSEDDSRSNGEHVVAIFREGRVATVMLRRGNQPSTPAALRVDRVIKGVF